MNSAIPFTKTLKYHHCRLSPLQFLQHLLVQYKQQGPVFRIPLHRLLELKHGLSQKPSQHLQFVPRPPVTQMLTKVALPINPSLSVYYPLPDRTTLLSDTLNASLTHFHYFPLFSSLNNTKIKLTVNYMVTRNYSITLCFAKTINLLECVGRMFHLVVN